MDSSSSYGESGYGPWLLAVIAGSTIGCGTVTASGTDKAIRLDPESVRPYITQSIVSSVFTVVLSCRASLFGEVYRDR